MWLDSIAKVSVTPGFEAADWALLGVVLAVLVAAIVVPNVVNSRTRRPQQEDVRDPLGRAA